MVSHTGPARLVFSNSSAGAWHGGEGGRDVLLLFGRCHWARWTLKEEAIPSTNVFHYKSTGEVG